MLITSILFIVLSNASTDRKDLSILFNRSLIGILLVALIIGFNSNNSMILYKGVNLLGGLFHNSSLTVSFHLFIIFLSLIIVQLTALPPREYINKNNITNQKFVKNMMIELRLFDLNKEHYHIIEYPLIMLFTIVGAVFIISSSNAVSLFLSIELQSYGLYLLCGVYKYSESATKASITYLLLGGLASCFILLGLTVIYFITGTSNLDAIYIIANLPSPNQLVDNAIYQYANNYINYSFVLVLLGFLFKTSAAPFHFWSPDVYDGVPTIVTTFIANIPKISLFIFLIGTAHGTNNLLASGFHWTNCLLISSLLSLIIGTILGLTQLRIKRLLAYSTISHIGFILLAISVNSVESIQAFLFYLMQYSITSINAFLIVISVGYTIYNNNGPENVVQEPDNSPIQNISQLKGYYFTNPVLAISFTIVIFSFVGIPPLIGFFGKQMVLSSALDKGFIFISFVAILTSVISAVYYLSVVKEIFFTKPDYIITESKYYIMTLSMYLSISISILTLTILLFIFNPTQWLSMTNILAVYILN